MRKSIRDNRPMLLFLTMAIVAHVLLLLVPVAKEVARRTDEAAMMRVVLRAAQPRIAVEDEIKHLPRDLPLEALPEPPREAAVPAETLAVENPSPPPEQARTEPVIETQPRVSHREIIARQFLMEPDSRQAYVRAIDEAQTVPDYFTAEKTTLEDALNQPVVQLPFRDTRTYELAYYEAGFNGAVDRFWDTVAVPFGFTTKNNTRIQCVWVLILAGCNWGHKTLYHREAEKRKTEGDELPY